MADLAAERVRAPVKKTLLFSDVHLKVSPEARTHREAFCAFLNGIPTDEYDRVICLGDLFDFWFEYRHVIFSGCFDVLCALARLRDAGLELHLLCGNHDFWAGRFLREELGMAIHPGPVMLPFGEKRALLAHGDGLNPSDYGYRIYKRFARNPLVIGAFRFLHPDWAMAIARAVSHGSRTMLQEEYPEKGPEAAALQRYARGILERGEADIVLCGHAHAPAMIECPAPSGAGLYINTGDWMGHRTHVIWDGETFRMYRGWPDAEAYSPVTSERD
jgi:UDP-2,3-diacylglucosamine hydrolase